MRINGITGVVVSQVTEAIKDLIEDANFECNSTGFNLQAMDSSHVSLVALNLRSDAFGHYRCDRNVSMGTCVYFFGRGCVCTIRSNNQSHDVLQE